MEQIVLLDQHDDAASVRSKLEALKPGAAAIVVPENNRALRGPIAMRIVRRQALDSALDLAVISENAAIRHTAQQQGFVVFGSLRSYRRALQRKESASRRWKGPLDAILRGAGVTTTLVLMASLSLVALAAVYLLMPRTTVVLVPVAQKIQERMEIVVDPDSKTINHESRTVPGRVVYVRAEGTEQIQVSGRQESSNAKAEGQVTLTNRTDQEVAVPRGTIAKTAGEERFAIQDDVKLAAGNQGMARVSVVAVEAGSRGNVGRGEITRLEGPLELQVAVFNEQPTSGGGSRSVEVVTDQDHAKAKETLQPKLEAEVLRKLEAERQRHEILAPESTRITALKEDYDREVGQQSKVLNLEMELRGNATFYSPVDVEAVVKGWSPRLKPGFYLRTETIIASEPRVVEAEGGTVRIAVDIEGVVSSRINEDRVRDNVRWKTAEEARKYLNNSLILAREPEIRTEPGWAGRALRVHVVVSNPRIEESQ